MRPIGRAFRRSSGFLVPCLMRGPNVAARHRTRRKPCWSSAEEREVHGEEDAFRHQRGKAYPFSRRNFLYKEEALSSPSILT